MRGPLSTDPGDATQLLQAASGGDERAAEELLPVVYDELRALARSRMRHRAPGDTLQPTALVHEAYLRLIDAAGVDWNGRGHFFGAAAQAMRQILVDQARRKASLKHGGDRRREDAEEAELAIEPPSIDVLALDEAIEELQKEDPEKAQIVMLRYFSGLTREETAAALNMSLRTCDRHWRYIVARFHRDLSV